MGIKRGRGKERQSAGGRQGEREGGRERGSLCCAKQATMQAHTCTPCKKTHARTHAHTHTHTRHRCNACMHACVDNSAQKMHAFTNILPASVLACTHANAQNTCRRGRRKNRRERAALLCLSSPTRHPFPTAFARAFQPTILCICICMHGHVCMCMRILTYTHTYAYKYIHIP
jgi:hypothetical protein